MTAITTPAPVSAPSRADLWSGRVLSGLFTAFMIFDIGIKMTKLPIVAETSAQLGWAPETTVPIGLLEAALLALYLIPRTSVFGALLFTGLFGGTVATHLRVGDPLFSHVLFGVYLAAFAWGGLYLRDPRLKAFSPFRR